MSPEVKVRFAPSPTGYLHIGGVRTALYNWLYAKNKSGRFVLRIEDTDTERSDDEYTKVILDGLKWIGLDWDEGPFFQSERTELYYSSLDKLLESGRAYECFCTPEELKERREEAKAKGDTFRYDGRCSKLSPERRKELRDSGILPAYRLNIPSEGTVSFNDIIKGKIEIDLATLDDFVIAKRNRMPLYNFACVIDDYDLAITHIIRGDDHIYNTHKQILIYKALGANIPEFAHLPQVHGPDGKKLSKRTGAVSLDEYRKMGYHPAALRNYLALLGWSTEDSQQLFKPGELIEKFSLERCSSSSGIFDKEKLDWINGKYIRDMAAEDIAAASHAFLEESGLLEEGKLSPRGLEAIELEKEKIAYLSDVPGLIDYLINEDFDYDEKAVGKRLKSDGVKDILEDAAAMFSSAPEFSHEILEGLIREYCEKNQLGAGKVFHPLRVAVSGRMKGPGVFELLQFLGKERSLARINKTLQKYFS